MTDSSDRFAYLGKLAGGLIHEINNPLSTIMVNLDLLKEELESSGEENKMALRKVETVRQETERLKEILDDFRSLTKGLELDPAPTSINELVEEILDFVNPELHRQNVTVMRSLAPDVPPCEVDRNLVKQALLNIVINAKDAMKDGGELMVRTSLEDGLVNVSVTDTGPGIPADKVDKIWDAYFSTKKQGSGLGLPTAKRIIEEHGGSVDVLSEPGRGSSFTVALPPTTRGASSSP
jgi:two-component system sensor histidine kinase HydH